MRPSLPMPIRLLSKLPLSNLPLSKLPLLRLPGLLSSLQTFPHSSKSRLGARNGKSPARARPTAGGAPRGWAPRGALRVANALRRRRGPSPQQSGRRQRPSAALGEGTSETALTRWYSGSTLERRGGVSIRMAGEGGGKGGGVQERMAVGGIPGRVFGGGISRRASGASSGAS